MMNYKTINVRFSREIVTNQATVTSSVELQPVFLIYAMYRLFAMVKIIPQVKKLFWKEINLLNWKNLHGKEM